MSPSATVKPDTSRTKEYVSIERGSLRTSATLRCPCLVDGRSLWGIYKTSFFNALEGDNSLSCPTQYTVCDRLLPGPPRCKTTDKNAKGSDFDSFET